VGITAARRVEEQAALVRSLGGVPVVGPCIDVDRPAPDALVRAALQVALAEPLDVAVFVTGVGAAHLVAVAQRSGLAGPLRVSLARARVVVRSGKPRRVLRELGVRVDWVADPPEGRAVRDELLRRPLAGRRVMVQCGGPAPDPMVGVLRVAGARVVTVHPYDIAPPADAAAAMRLARDAAAGLLDAVTFTSAHAVHGFVALAERAGVEPAAAGDGALVAAVGPVTRDALLGHGLRVDVEPATPRMGAMLRALAARLTGAVA
jgi:uroporphyrinogen-III synthase